MGEGFTMEVFRKIFNDRDGTFVEVRPDRDGLGLVEIISSEGRTSLIFLPAEAKMIADALTECAEEVDRNA